LLNHEGLDPLTQSTWPVKLVLMSSARLSRHCLQPYNNLLESVSDPFGVRFKFCLKRWVRNCASEPTWKRISTACQRNLTLLLDYQLLPSSPAIRITLSLRQPDVYNPLQIFLNEAGSYEFDVLACGSVFSRADFSYTVAFIPLELPPTGINLPRKPVPLLPPWLRHDASMLILRPPPWPNW